MKTAEEKKHKKDVHKRYMELSTSCSKNTYIKDKNYRKLLDDVITINYTVESLRIKYNQIQSRFKNPEKVMEGLPIESLGDYFEAVKYGKPLKPSYADLIEAEKIKKIGISTLDEKEDLMRNARLAYIDLLEAKVRFLLKQMES